MSDARFNPAPGWPVPPAGWTPPPGWQPDPSWPPAPPGWNLWLNADGTPAAPPVTSASPAAPTSMAPTPAVPYAGTDAGQSPYAGTPGTASEADVQAAITQVRSSGLKQILIGVGLVVVGVVITVVSYASTPAGGRFSVFWALPLVGVVYAIRGAIQMGTAERKVRQQLGVAAPAPSAPQPGQWPGA